MKNHEWTISVHYIILTDNVSINILKKYLMYHISFGTFTGRIVRSANVTLERALLFILLSSKQSAYWYKESISGLTK